VKEQKFKILVLEDGRIVIEDADVRKGQTVEVTLSVSNPVGPTWPLRGLPVRYRDPFLGIDEPEWESSR